MKSFVVFAFALACVAADVSNTGEYTANVLRSDFESQPEGGFQYGYETSNGIYAQAQGVVKNVNSEYPALTISGGYKYTAPDGTPIEVTYVSDENGFRPVGSHLPVPPPAPEYVARSLAYIEANTQKAPLPKALTALLG